MKCKNILLKNILLSASTALLLLTSTSCELDLAPESSISSLSFFKTEEHCKQAMMGVYRIMYSENTYGFMPIYDALGPVGNCSKGGNYNFGAIMKDEYTSQMTNIQDFWQALYEGVARSNNVLQNIGQAEIDEATLNRYRAEARFFRGMFYFRMANLWGGVPVYDDSFNVGANYREMLKPRETEDSVRNFAIKDLDFAAKYLPEKWDQSNYGRVTRGAALALKGKMLLYCKRYKEASECFQAVINSNMYALFPDYAKLFTPEGDSSSEMIFAIQALGGVGQDFGLPFAYYMGTRSSYTLNCTGNFNYFLPSNSLVEEYEWCDGKPFSWEEFIPGFYTDKSSSTSNPYPTRKKTFLATLDSSKKKVKTYPADKDKLVKMWKERDPRLNANVILPYTKFTGWYDHKEVELEFAVAKGVVDGGSLLRLDKDRLCYVWRKFVPTGNMNGAINSNKNTPINFPLIRYADVLLMQAECLNELGQGEDAVKLINEVRARQSVNMPALNSGPAYLEAKDHDEIFKRIRHERICELAAEGHSFFDYKRWHVLEELNGVQEGHMTGDYVFHTRKITDRDYQWPIPLVEIDRNPNLTQSFGF